MSSCLSGGGRTYGIDLEIVKSSPTSTRTSNSSSPSSTLSESINSPLTIRKPRTPRKRPNQTYNEAAALLSTVYPNIFSTKNLRKPSKHTKVYNSLSEEFAEFLPLRSTFENAEFLLHRPISEKPIFRIEPKPMNSSEKPYQGLNIDCDFRLDSLSPCDAFKEDFDADSILDEEMEEGMDSIMGNLRMNNDTYDDSNVSNGQIDAYYENPMGFDFCGKFEFGFGSIRPLRCIDDGDWWRFPAINVLDISPKLNKVSFDKKEKLERGEELKNFPKSSKEKTNSSLSLKLNYDEILNAWSNRGSPFSDDIPGTEYSEADAIARLAQIDLFSENGGMREASVLRYREKKRSRLFSKKIRYQVRKINADQRPRMKGRFVRRPTSTLKDQEMKIK